MGPSQRPGQSEHVSSSLRTTDVKTYNYTKQVEETDHLIDAQTVPLYFREMAGDDPKKQKNAEDFEAIFEKTEALKAKGINVQHRVYFSGEDFQEFLDGNYQSEWLLKTVESIESALLRFAPDGFKPPLEVVQFWGDSHYEQGESNDNTKLFLYKGIPDEYIQAKLMVRLMENAESKDRQLAQESQELLTRHLQPAALASQLAQAELGVADSSFAPEVVEAMGLIQTDEFNGAEQVTTNVPGTRLVLTGMPQFVSKQVLESPQNYTNFFWAEFARDPEEFFTRCLNEATQREPQGDPTTSLLYQFAVNLRRIDAAMGDIHYECEVNQTTIRLKEMHVAFNEAEKTNEAYIEVLRGFLPTTEVAEEQTPIPAPEDTPESEPDVPSEDPTSDVVSAVPASQPLESWTSNIDWAGWRERGASAFEGLKSRIRALTPQPSAMPNPAIEETAEQIAPPAPNREEPEVVVVEPETGEIVSEEPVSEEAPRLELEAEIIMPDPIDEPVIERAYTGGSSDVVRTEPEVAEKPTIVMQPIQILPDSVRASRIQQIQLNLLSRATTVETQLVEGERGTALTYAPVDIAEQSARIERFSAQAPDPENESGPQVLDEVMPAEYWEKVREKYPNIEGKLETLESTIQRLNARYKVEIGIDYLADIDLFKEALAQDEPAYGVNLKILGNVDDVIRTLETTQEALAFYSPEDPFAGQRINVIWFDRYESNVQGTASRKGVTLKNGVEIGTIHHELGHVLDFKEGTNWERVWVQKEFEHAIARKRAIDVWMQRDMGSLVGLNDEQLMEKRIAWLEMKQETGEATINYSFNGQSRSINIADYINPNGSFRGSPTQYSLTNGAEERAEIWREFAEGGLNRLDADSKDRFEVMATGLTNSGTLSAGWFRSQGVSNELLDGSIT